MLSISIARRGTRTSSCTRPHRGVPNRRCADAIVYILRTGCQGEALRQTQLCAKSTAHDRFQTQVIALVRATIESLVVTGKT